MFYICIYLFFLDWFAYTFVFLSHKLWGGRQRGLKNVCKCRQACDFGITHRSVKAVAGSTWCVFLLSAMDTQLCGEMQWTAVFQRFRKPSSGMSCDALFNLQEVKSVSRVSFQTACSSLAVWGFSWRSTRFSIVLRSASLSPSVSDSVGLYLAVYDLDLDRQLAVSLWLRLAQS